MKRVNTWFLCGVLLASHVVAQEQEQSVESLVEGAIQAAGAARQTEMRQTPTSGDSSRARATIEAGSANGRAQIKWRPTGGSDFELSLSTPQDKDAESTDFTNLDGLADGLKLSLSKEWGFGQVLDLSEAEGLEKALDLACDTLGWDKSLMKCSDEGAFFAALNDEHEETKPGVDVQEVIKELLLKTESDRWFSGLQLELAGSYKEFDFFDSEAMKKDDSEVSWSATFGGYAFRNSLRIGASATFQNAFQDAATKVQKCTGIEAVETLESCETLAFGAPVDDDKVIARLEVLRLWQKWALNPTLSFDLEDDEVGIDFPVYLIRDDKDVLTGGVRFGWRSDTDEPVASIFLSKPLGKPSGS